MPIAPPPFPLLALAAALLIALLPEAGGHPSLAGARVAYIDPGAGSFVVQALVAFLAAAAVTLRAYWKRIRALFGRSARGEEDPDASNAASGDD